MARVGFVSLVLLVLATPSTADECETYRTAIDVVVAATAAYRATRHEDNSSTYIRGLTEAMEGRQVAKEAVHYYPDDTTRALSEIALAARIRSAEVTLQRPFSEGDWRVANDVALVAEQVYHEAVYAAACQ